MARRVRLQSFGRELQVTLQQALAPRARQAIVLAATHLRSLGSQDLALRSDDVEGVGTKTWTVSDAAQKLIQTTVDALLTPYRVWRV